MISKTTMYNASQARNALVLSAYRRRAQEIARMDEQAARMRTLSPAERAAVNAHTSPWS